MTPPAPWPTNESAPDLDEIALEWERTLDADDRALNAAGARPIGLDVAARHRDLVQERLQTAGLLAGIAELEGVHPAPWLSPFPVSRKMLGLPAHVDACLFDLDGVLTNSGVLHAQAWADTFDELLLRFAERRGWSVVPVDRTGDYRSYVDGRPRIEGVHAFLASRGIHLAEGRPDDPAAADTAYGVARRKSEGLTHGLGRRGINTVIGARRYLEATGFAGLARCVVSASTRTLPMLELAGLSALVEEHVDADAMLAEGLRSRPAPDLLLAACARLAVRPEHTVTFTHSPAGIAAGHAAGLVVIGIAGDELGEVFRGFGAERVVPSLSSLLDRRLGA